MPVVTRDGLVSGEDLGKRVVNLYPFGGIFKSGDVELTVRTVPGLPRTFYLRHGKYVDAVAVQASGIDHEAFASVRSGLPIWRMAGQTSVAPSTAWRR